VKIPHHINVTSFT